MRLACIWGQSGAGVGLKPSPCTQHQGTVMAGPEFCGHWDYLRSWDHAGTMGPEVLRTSQVLELVWILMKAWRAEPWALSLRPEKTTDARFYQGGPGTGVHGTIRCSLHFSSLMQKLPFFTHNLLRLEEVTCRMCKCPFYPLQCVFSYFCVTPMGCNLSSGFLSIYQGIFMCG